MCQHHLYPYCWGRHSYWKNKNQEFLAFSIMFIGLLHVEKQARQLALTPMDAGATEELQLVHLFPCWWTLGWFQVCLGTSLLLSLCVQFLGAPYLTVEIARQGTCRSPVLWDCINIIGVNLCLPRCAGSNPLKSSPTWEGWIRFFADQCEDPPPVVLLCFLVNRKRTFLQSGSLLFIFCSIVACLFLCILDSGSFRQGLWVK